MHMLSSTHIDFLKHISNNPTLSINEMSKTFNRTASFLRSEINTLNQYLSVESKIEVINSDIISTLSYDDFLIFMKSLSFEDYKVNIGERHKMLIILAYFNDFINLSEIYSKWNLSMTTRKNDIKSLENILKKYNLHIERYPGKGIKITGDPLQYRVLVVSIISICIDVITSGIRMRKANNPVERNIYDYFFQKTSTKFDEASELVNNFLVEYQTKLNYYSNKFFQLYVILVLYQNESPITDISKLPLNPHNFYIFDNRNENTAFNQVVSMIDFDPIISFPYNKELMKLTKELVKKVSKAENQMIYTEKKMIDDLYTFIYRQYFFNHFNYNYSDKLVEGTRDIYPERFNFIASSLSDIESYLLLSFNEEQITSITLICSKWILKNQIYGEDAKRIILVTNIGYERVNYFIESLKSYIDFEHVATVDVNEVHLLDSLDFDLLLTFSNRTSSILKNLGHDSLQIEYFLDYENITKLYYAGCSIAKKHIIATKLLNDLEGKSRKKKLEYLRKKQGHTFL